VVLEERMGHVGTVSRNVVTPSFTYADSMGVNVITSIFWTKLNLRVTWSTSAPKKSGKHT
jgi:hypothetical protein